VDVEKLIGEVAARNGIRIEPDDPAFALVTLNQLVLEEAVRNLVNEIRAATSDFECAAERIQNRAGAMLARGLAERSSPVRNHGRCNLGYFRQAAAFWLYSAGFSFILLGIGAWIGRLIWPCR
jgi:urease accessory protein UreH